MRVGETATRSQAVPQETQVLIIGGGPTGLSAAVELGCQGVQQRHTQYSILVRACGYFDARRQGKQGNDGHLGWETLHEKKWEKNNCSLFYHTWLHHQK